MEELKTQLNAIRAHEKEYQCPWCPTSPKPAKFKLVARAVAHLSSKHTELWNAISGDKQTVLSDATPTDWEEVFLSISPLPPLAKTTAKFTQMLHAVRDALKSLHPVPAPLAVPPGQHPRASDLAEPPVSSPASASASEPATAVLLPSEAPSALPPTPPPVLPPPLPPLRVAPASETTPALAHLPVRRQRQRKRPMAERSSPPGTPPPVPATRLPTPKLAQHPPMRAVEVVDSESEGDSEGTRRHRRHTLEPSAKKRVTKPKRAYSPPHGS
jgi:hypothetical protein